MLSETMRPTLATQPKKSRPRIQWVQRYTSAVTILGLAVVLLSLFNLPQDRVGLLLFTLLAAIAQFYDVELFHSSHSRISVSSIIAIASILVFGPFAGALVHVISGLVTLVTTSLGTQGTQSGRASLIRRSAFNMGMFATAAGIAGLVYDLAGGTRMTLTEPSNIIPLVAMSTADVVANLAILIGVITLQTGRPPWQIWRQDFQWAAPIAVVGGVLGGGSLALAYAMFGVLGLAVFFLPVLSIAYSFRLYVANTSGYLEQLETMNSSLDEANIGLLETLGAVIDAYDVYTNGHAAQVAIYAEAIANKMGLSPDEQALIVKAALVHDVGKIGVMDSIMGKPGRLTDAEFDLMKRHPVIGAEIVGRMKGLQDLLPLVRSHHERWDGRGYPDGLVAEEAPLGARILTLADSLDAMFSDRPYRPLRSFEEVKVEIERCAGAQFDPLVVDAFLALAAEQDEAFFRNSAATVDRAVSLFGLDNLDTAARLLKKSMIPSRSPEKSASL